LKRLTLILILFQSSFLFGQEVNFLEENKNIETSYKALLNGDYAIAVTLLEKEIFKNNNSDAVPYYAVSFCVAPDDKKPSDRSWRKALRLAKKAKNNWGANYEPRFFKKAKQLIIDKADSGNAVAQYRLANAYFLGKGIDKNIELAINYMKMAADQGLSCAQHNLGLYYGEGVHTDQDLEKAIDYMEMSLAKNHRKVAADFLKKLKAQKEESEK